MDIKNIKELDTDGLNSVEYSEEVNEAVNLRLREILKELDYIITEYGDYVRPSEASHVFQAALDYGTNAVDNNGPETIRYSLNDFLGDPDNCEIIRSLAPATFANILMQCFGPQVDGDIDKHMAVDVAEHIGPDYAQVLYRFAVLVTKLA